MAKIIYRLLHGRGGENGGKTDRTDCTDGDIERSI